MYNNYVCVCVCKCIRMWGGRIGRQWVCMCKRVYMHAVLEITVGHWPFSDQFEHSADQNLF